MKKVGTKKSAVESISAAAQAMKKVGTKKSAVEKVTDAIIKKLEEGTAPWSKPWSGGDSGRPKNFFTKKPYRGFNVLMLSWAGYDCPYWATFKQIAEKGGSVKGQKSTPIVFWGKTKEKKNAEGKVTKESYSFVQYYNVFNLEQTTGLDYEAPVQPDNQWDGIAEAEKIVEKYVGDLFGPKVRHQEARAYYVPSRDFVNMPKRNLFAKGEEYYSTLFHELGHSTGHEDRLNRKTLVDATYFGSTNYSKEELVAEFTAAMLCGISGIENTIDNSAAYVAGWLGKLKNDRGMIISAASKAQYAVDHILGGTAPALEEEEKVAEKTA